MVTTRSLAVDCQEEVPFTDPTHIRADISTHPEFANFGLDADDWGFVQLGLQPTSG
jgi:hypothetical protein